MLKLTKEIPSPTILIVEDEMLIAAHIKYAVENLGYEVVDLVTSGQAALEVAAQKKPDLILMDIHLHGEMDGVAAAEQIRTNFSIPVIYLTAYADKNTLERAKITEPFGYLTKPFKDRELEITIEMALYKHKLERKLKENEHWLAATLRSIGEGVITTDPQGRINLMNEVAQQLTGYPEPEAVGQPISHVLTLVDSQGEPLEPHPVEEVLSAPKNIDRTSHHNLISRAGAQLAIEYNATLISAEGESPQGAVIVFKNVTERNKKEQALRQAHQKLDATLNALPDLLFELDSQQRIIDFRAPDPDVLYASPQDFFGKTFQEILPAEANEIISMGLKEARSMGRATGLVYSLPLNNKIRWFEMSITRKGAKQNPSYIFVARDITDRKQNEAELQKLSSVVEQTADHVIITDKEGVIEYVNPAFERLTGYSLAEARGQTPRILKSGKYDQDFYQKLWDTILAGAVFRGVIINKKKNGELFYEEKTITPLKDSEGNLTHFVSTGKDISDRMEATIALQEREKQYRQISELISDYAYAFKIEADETVTREWVVGAFTRITGYTLSEVDQLGDWSQLIYSQDWDVIEQRKAILRAGRPDVSEFRIVTKTGELRWLRDYARPVEDKQRGVTYLYGAAQDITGRKELETRLEAIYHLGQELTLIQDEQTIIQRVLDTAQHSLQFDIVGCGLVDQAANQLEFKYYLVAGAHRELKTTLPLAGSASIGVAVVRSGAPLNIPDVEADPRYVPLPGHTERVRSELCVPMKIEERVLGVLNAESIDLDDFSDSDEQLLQTLATQAAVALENAHLYRRAERWAEELLIINQATRGMASTLELEAVLEQAMTEAQNLLQVEGASVMLYDEETEQLNFTAAAGPDLISLVGSDIPLENSLAGLVIQDRQPLIVDNVQEHPRFYKEIDKQTNLTTHSLIAMPIIFNQTVLGVVEAINKRRGPFGPHDLELLGALSSAAAIAIQNARLYQAEREQYRRLQQSQAQLVQVEKMAALGRLVASIAHEINNPIQAIQNCLDLIKEELEDQSRPDKLNFYTDIAKGELKRIAGIVRRMRDFYRSNRDQSTDASLDDFYRLTPEKLQPVDVHAILESVLQLAGKQLQHSGVILTSCWADALPPISGSADHLKQIFLNLVLNAIDALEEDGGGTLYISTTQTRARLQNNQSEPAVAIEFKDTGPGIPAQVRNRIFEPLFTTKKQGSGFGLFISYKIVEAHQGQITLDSQEGKGTTFTIYLPLHPRPETQK